MKKIETKKLFPNTKLKMKLFVISFYLAFLLVSLVLVRGKYIVLVNVLVKCYNIGREVKL